MANGTEKSLALQRRDATACEERMAKMSHDFRARLNIIIGFTELLLAEVPGKINDKQRSSLNDILESSRHLQGLLRDYVEAPPDDSR